MVLKYDWNICLFSDRRSSPYGIYDVLFDHVFYSGYPIATAVSDQQPVCLINTLVGDSLQDS